MFKTDINLNLYKTFYELSKYKSFSETAKQTYMSQSAISKSIKKLEDELGTQLFVRKKNGVDLTEKGEELLFFVEQSFNSLVTAERRMLETNNLDRGKISIGMPSNIGSFYLFDHIIKFHNDYPNIEVTIITGSTTKLLSLLESHEVDFIIDTPPFKNLDKNKTLIKLDTVNYCFISKEKRNITSVKELEKEQLILPIPKTENRNKLDLVFKEKNTEVQNVLNIHTTEMIIAAVKRNLGIGYVIEDLVKYEIDNKELYKVPIKEELQKIDIDLIYDFNYLTTAGIKFLKEYMNIDMK
ncbi:MAG: LysR family transcriptional regulator [Bacilli bacterium]|nr:LysR family transcriptional regulator [Bacilli bacterium]